MKWLDAECALVRIARRHLDGGIRERTERGHCSFTEDAKWSDKEMNYLECRRC